MEESRSFLEQWIRKVLWKPKKSAWVAATVMTLLGFVLAASAAEVSPPDAPPLGPSAAQGSAVGLRHF
jgi:hypothetical protein